MPNIVGDIVGFSEYASHNYAFLIINEAETKEVLTLYIPRNKLDKEVITLAFLKQRDLFIQADEKGIVNMLCFIDAAGGLYNDPK